MIESRDRPSYFIEAYGYSEDSLKLGFAWLLQVSKGQEAVLALPQKNNIENAVLAVLGRQAAGALQKQEQIVVNNSRIRLLTQRGWAPYCAVPRL